MILAGASLLNFVNTKPGSLAARAISESCFEAVYHGIRTADLGGHAATTEFTDEVIKRVRSKLEIWPTLS